MLQREGFQAGFDRVYRHWRREGLKVPKTLWKKRRLGTSANGCTHQRVSRQNQVWAWDFSHHDDPPGQVRSPGAGPARLPEGHRIPRRGDAGRPRLVVLPAEPPGQPGRRRRQRRDHDDRLGSDWRRRHRRRVRLREPAHQPDVLRRLAGAAGGRPGAAPGTAEDQGPRTAGADRRLLPVADLHELPRPAAQHDHRELRAAQLRVRRSRHRPGGGLTHAAELPR